MGMKLLEPALYQQRRGTRPTWLSSDPGHRRALNSSSGDSFKAFPGPSTSSSRHGPPGPGAARQSPEPDGAPDSR